MKIDATIQAKGDEELPGERRSGRARIELLANELRRCGFEIVRAGRFGVTVRGDAADFKRTFGVDPLTSRAAFHKVHGGELEELVEGIEMPSRSLLYR